MAKKAKNQVPTRSVLYKVTIHGVTPLLMHRDAFDEVEVLSGGKKGDDRTPSDRWKQYLYLENGRVVMPEANIKAALEKAGAAISIGGKLTLKRPIVAGCFFDTPFLPLLVEDEEVTIDTIDAITGDFEQQCVGAREAGFSLDIHRVKIGASRHIRVRPRFDVWTCVGTCEVMIPEEITFDRLAECFRIAGNSAGLCDWRPASPKRAGSFGRFESRVELLS
jgi:hypothetical protein